MGVVPHKGKPGRPRLHGTNAAKAKDHRERQKQAWLAQLDLINGTSVVTGRYPWLGQEVRAHMREFAREHARDEKSLEVGDYVTPAPSTSGTAYASVHTNVPLGHV